MEINYLKHEEINRIKWDKCISASVNGIVYAYSWYLDIVSYQWEALVLGDYEAVMPLTIGKKYGIQYMLQPKYTQQLGVFTSSLLNDELVNAFLKAIPRENKYIDIQLNTYNKVSLEEFKVKPKVTYEIDLISAYDGLQKHYNTNTKRNIKKAKKLGVQISKHVNLNELLTLKKETSPIAVTLEHLNMLRRIIPFTQKHNMGVGYGAYNDKNELIAAAYFIKSHNKSIYLQSASNQEGKDLRAMFLLVDEYMIDNAETNMTLDFEGSSIESLARFYKGFGAKPVYFNQVQANRLPWFLKFLK